MSSSACLLQPGTLPDVLELEVGGTVFRRELKSWTEYSEETQREHRSWRAWDKPPTTRHALFRELYPELQRLGEKERGEALTALRSLAAQPPCVRASHRVLTADEARALSRLEKVEIGAHTVSHPRLSALSPVEQEREIVTSKQRLEEIVRYSRHELRLPEWLDKRLRQRDGRAGRTGRVCLRVRSRSHASDVAREAIRAPAWRNPRFVGRP